MIVWSPLGYHKNHYLEVINEIPTRKRNFMHICMLVASWLLGEFSGYFLGYFLMLLNWHPGD